MVNFQLNESFGLSDQSVCNKNNDDLKIVQWSINVLNGDLIENEKNWFETTF